MGQRLGAVVPPFGGGSWVPINTMWLGRALPPYRVASWSIKPFGQNTPTLQDTQKPDNGPIA